MRGKMMVLLFLFMCLEASAQELIVITGAGLNKTDTISKGDYGFAQGRLMFNLTPGLRVGPYLGYTQYSANELNKTPNSTMLGKEWSYGLSADGFGHLSYAYAYYFWLNTGLKNVHDRFQDGSFGSVTKSSEIFVSGGFFVTDDFQGWFGNNRLMFEYQKPTSQSMTATWKGEVIPSLKPYNKEALRLFIESGVKRFGSDGVNIEPLIHVAYGNDFGRKQAYYELGGGIDLGIFRGYYRDILKAKIFQRKDFGGKNLAMCGEIVFSPTTLIQVLKKNK